MKDPYSLPESDRRRLTRTEMQSMQWFMNAVSTLRYAQEDLKERLTWVPGGTARINMLVGSATSLLTDIAGTIPFKQRNHLVNVAKDMEMRIVPKMSAKTVSVVLTKEDGMELVDAAQEKCRHCAKFNEESERCRLRKLLEVTVPLEDYGSMLCPYARAEWEDQ